MAVVLSVVALVFVWVFLPAFGRNVYAVFYLAVVLSAWNGGLGPAVLAGPSACWPTSSFSRRRSGLDCSRGLAESCIFVLVACLVALITDRLDRTNRALDRRWPSSATRGQMRAVVDGVVEALLLVAPTARAERQPPVRRPVRDDSPR